MVVSSLSMIFTPSIKKNTLNSSFFHLGKLLAAKQTFRLKKDNDYWKYYSIYQYTEYL